MSSLLRRAIGGREPSRQWNRGQEIQGEAGSGPSWLVQLHFHDGGIVGEGEQQFSGRVVQDLAAQLPRGPGDLRAHDARIRNELRVYVLPARVHGGYHELIS